MIFFSTSIYEITIMAGYKINKGKAYLWKLLPGNTPVEITRDLLRRLDYSYREIFVEFIYKRSDYKLYY